MKNEQIQTLMNSVEFISSVKEFNPEIPSYVGYVYKNKPKQLDLLFLFVVYIYVCYKIIFRIFETINRK